MSKDRNANENIRSGAVSGDAHVAKSGRIRIGHAAQQEEGGRWRYELFRLTLSMRGINDPQDAYQP